MPQVPSASVIVPLYLYPVDTVTWQPLYQAISNNPDLQFVVIVNPNSGPGVDPDGWLPDKHYSREVPRLTAYENVKIVGYVRIDYCRRLVSDVNEDIRKYANWSGTASRNLVGNMQPESAPTGSTQFAVHGIFFDEVPNVWEVEHAGYLEDIGILVKEVDGIVGDRLVFHNCGTVPDSEFAMYWRGIYKNRKITRFRSSTALPRGQHRGSLERAAGSTKTLVGSPDVTVVFEESSALWHEAKSQTRLAELLRYKRGNCCYMVHSVPQHLVRTLTRDLRSRGAFLFVTDLEDRYYESFGKMWDEFVSAMAVQDDEGDDKLLTTIESTSTWIRSVAHDTLRGLNCPIF